MSPLLPPVGAPVDTVLTPNPLEFVAILKILDEDKSPPPASPAPADIITDSEAAPS